MELFSNDRCTGGRDFIGVSILEGHGKSTGIYNISGSYEIKRRAFSDIGIITVNIFMTI